MNKRHTRVFEGFAAESGAGLLRIATLLTCFQQGTYLLWYPLANPVPRTSALCLVLATDGGHERLPNVP
jgi:hypothetical protein